MLLALCCDHHGFEKMRECVEVHYHYHNSTSMLFAFCQGSKRPTSTATTPPKKDNSIKNLTENNANITKPRPLKTRSRSHFSCLDVVGLCGLAPSQHVVETSKDVLGEVDALAGLADPAHGDRAHAVENVRVACSHAQQADFKTSSFSVLFFLK